MQGISQEPASPETAVKNIKGRRKARWKLKFHHQALPPEYLDHSRRVQLQEEAAAAAALEAAATAAGLEAAAAARRSSSVPALTASTVRYTDLPYMGEMTLENARPRRGRKPKKADICHLVYKNYGTTVVEEPLNLCLRDLAARPPAQVCKFKFTGGPSPTLKEKKVLSMEAGGTFKAESRPRSRRSLARERLEQTFREKGFLIQTERLESAQGATYCKFRQLRKFTRYLFRSWKHHLPGEVTSENLSPD